MHPSLPEFPNRRRMTTYSSADLGSFRVIWDGCCKEENKSLFLPNVYTTSRRSARYDSRASAEPGPTSCSLSATPTRQSRAETDGTNNSANAPAETEGGSQHARCLNAEPIRLRVGLQIRQ